MKRLMTIALLAGASLLATIASSAQAHDRYDGYDQRRVICRDNPQVNLDLRFGGLPLIVGVERTVWDRPVIERRYIERDDYRWHEAPRYIEPRRDYVNVYRSNYRNDYRSDWRDDWHDHHRDEWRDRWHERDGDHFRDEHRRDREIHEWREFHRR